MKKLIHISFLAAFMLVPLFASAQDTVSVRDLNTYPDLTEYSESAIQDHPLAGELVTYTGVIVSYPKSSGLATPEEDSEGNVTDIGRIHVFITDTAAVNQGREGMSIQIVESDWELLADFPRGEVVTFTGELTFFGSTAQMTAETAVSQGNVNTEFPQYAELLNPWEISVTDLNTANGDGTYQVNIANYPDYNGSYVKINNATVSNVSTGDRPNWAINENGSRIYIYDTSLRMRNDRVAYLDGWNYRHGDDPDFVPPAPGAVVNVSGFVTMTGDDPDGNVAPDQIALSINPFEDGVLWSNNERFVDGETYDGVEFDWPNDIEVVGLPPVFSEAALSDSSVTSSDAVTVSVNVDGVDGATIQEVDLVYSAGGTTDTLAMSASGNTYSATLPTFDNFTAVSFYFVATDSEGLTGRDPISGEYGFFVQDFAIDAISFVQKTSDGGPGASPLAGAGQLEMNLNGTIVADNNDGVIIVQDAAATWSGVFLELTDTTRSLSRGDEINIVGATVAEAPVASNSLTLTYLTNLDFSVTSTGNDVDAVVPTVHTDSVASMSAGGELEAYEGMLVKFEDVELDSRGAFGEYVFRNTDADSADGAIFNEDIRSDDYVGGVAVPYELNTVVRSGIVFDAYAVVAASFGAPKFHPRSLADLIADGGNAFTPNLMFGLNSPADSATVEVTSDISVDWEATEDWDGDDLTYEWVLYSADTSSVITTVSSGGEASVALGFDTVDGLLEDAGLAVGDTASFMWNVRVSDGLDTLDVHGPYGNFGDDFAPIYRLLTLVRGEGGVPVEENDGIPATFALEQNYPNPFNPTTQIAFDLPQASDVKLNVYDMLGRKVATIVNEQMNAGSHKVKFDAARLASGMYIYRIEAGSFISTKKMMLIK